jgi:hypothetical protein
MTFSLVGTAAGAQGTGAVTPTMPTYAAGDLALYFAFARVAAETVSSAPAGYVLLEDAVTSNSNLNVYGKICTSSESAPSITYSGSGRHLAVMAVLRSSTGWPALSVASDIVADAAESSGGTAAGCPNSALTVTENNTCVLCVTGKRTTSNDISGTTAPSGFSEAAIQIYNSISVGAVLVAWFQGQTTTANVSATTQTLSVTNDTGTTDRLALSLRSSAVKYLKLRAHSSAASATGVEGVVLNSTRDTVIGEFTGQAFEASLESGEAVLKIAVADISPDGSTLTTLDTPLVAAYNTTDGTVGLGSATVIEE